MKRRTPRSRAGRPAGVPLGLLADISYDRVVVKPQSGDLVVLYDGASEATNRAETELGRDGLMNLARGLAPTSAQAFGMQLTHRLRNFREGVAAADDETVIVLQRTAENVGKPRTDSCLLKPSRRDERDRARLAAASAGTASC